MNEILQFLEKHGEKPDTEIAAATGISLTNVYLHLSHLVARGEVLACRSTKLDKEGKKTYGVSCRLPSGR